MVEVLSGAAYLNSPSEPGSESPSSGSKNMIPGISNPANGSKWFVSQTFPSSLLILNFSGTYG